MSKALSLDPRARVLAAIAGGVSCRQAAQRLGVSASGAIRWRSLERRQGDARPKALGGDRRSGRIEARAGLILGLVDETPDITLEELRTALVARGIVVGLFAAASASRPMRPRVSSDAGACTLTMSDVAISSSRLAQRRRCGSVSQSSMVHMGNADA